MRQAVWAAVSCLKRGRDNGEYRLVMLTLTYRRVDQWGARDIRQAVRWCKRHGSGGYVWVAELQRRGAVHYHLLTEWPVGARWVKPTATAGGWSKGFTWVTNGVRYPWYLMKYIQKGAGNGKRTVYPSGLRIYGISQSVVRRMYFEERSAFRDIQLPAWFRNGEKDRATRCGSYRVVGGVDYRGAVETSPYVAYNPPRVAFKAELG